ncbi:hypothetical protein BT96DRAFT_1092495 [Gymnopus androsaceus JB14]|uniref:Uncharacterized protein n=1 Tax=Gymnopus androsaceus JB14 TaxID=1447944 RepID=A0A6A4HUH1_9AGAR|nr:hypothetical protein BT96DRAFT_1092495 [Gymnopus androsaceus JB14]
MSSMLRSSERTAEIRDSLAIIRSCVDSASGSTSNQSEGSSLETPPRRLSTVSKYKPSADILVCYEDGQRDFGENYVQYYDQS